MRLRRGHELREGVSVQEADPKAEEADEAAAAQPVDKLLLVVHGIGQNLTGSNIASKQPPPPPTPPHPNPHPFLLPLLPFLKLQDTFWS
jgi:hypothetical protein